MVVNVQVQETSRRFADQIESHQVTRLDKIAVTLLVDFKSTVVVCSLVRVFFLEQHFLTFLSLFLYSHNIFYIFPV